MLVLVFGAMLFLWMTLFFWGGAYLAWNELREAGSRYNILEWSLVLIIMLFCTVLGVACGLGMLSRVLKHLGLPVPNWLPTATTQAPEEQLRKACLMVTEIVGAYGRVLEGIPVSQRYVPVTSLPFPKELIRDTIHLLYAMVSQGYSREYIKAWYTADVATRMLSETFVHSLRTGIATLPYCLPEDEWAMMHEFMASNEAAADVVRGGPPLETTALLTMAKRDADPSYIHEILRIWTRILEESRHYLAEFDQVRTELSGSSQRQRRS